MITLVLAYFNLVFGELVPKRIAMQKSEQLALGMANMLYGVSKVAAPLVALLTFSTNTILKLIGIAPNQEDDAVTEEEIRLMLAEGNEQGIIDEHENKIIQNVFEFDDISAEQLCTHRMDVCGWIRRIPWRLGSKPSGRKTIAFTRCMKEIRTKSSVCWIRNIISV